MTLKSDAKFEDLENDMRNLPNFYHNTQKFPNWDFDGILLSKAEQLCIMTMKNDAKFEEKLTCCFKIVTTF